MKLVVRLILLFTLLLTGQSAIATTIKFTTHQYDVNQNMLSKVNYGYDGVLILPYDISNPKSSRETKLGGQNYVYDNIGNL